MLARFSGDDNNIVTSQSTALATCRELSCFDLSSTVGPQDMQPAGTASSAADNVLSTSATMAMPSQHITVTLLVDEETEQVLLGKTLHPDLPWRVGNKAHEWPNSRILNPYDYCECVALTPGEQGPVFPN